jgi:hypothetical protein
MNQNVYYIYEPNVYYLGIAKGIVKYGSAARHPSPEVAHQVPVLPGVT